QVTPASDERATITSEASARPATASDQCATSTLPLWRTADGTSTQLARIVAPSAIVLGAVHPLSASSESRTRFPPSCPPGSIHVSSARSPLLVRFGDSAPGALGGSSALMRAATRDGERSHAALQIDAHTRALVVAARCFRFSGFRTNDSFMSRLIIATPR